YFRDLDLEYQRVPSGVFLICSALEVHDVSVLYKAVETKENLKILCLDQVTDVHNAAAILRTASFYGVDYVVIPDKRSFGLTPSFFRIASGATEFVPLVGVSKLTRTMVKLKELGVNCLALSEHVKGELAPKQFEKQSTCLVFGREDVGISNAVLRVVDNHISLKSLGDTKSLNVSIAAAITMEKCFIS
ncbi:MAG: RNA methyltransferase, partial [Halobacteriovoraceae bacterium]|nr:RNA methyltransferase [Halobacteriovoraceae bacterium]